MRGNWQGYYWQDASRGHSSIAELLVSLIVALSNLVVYVHFQNMSAFVERPVEISKTEWLESLQRLQVTRTDMNRLVMNYLVTGTCCSLSVSLWEICSSHVNYCQDFYCAGSVCCEKCRNVCGCEWHWKDVPSGLLYWPVAISRVVSIKHRPSVLLSICPIRYSCS